MLLKPCPICFSNDSIYERTINEIGLLKCGTCGFVYANLDDERINAANSSCDEGFSSRQKERQTILDEMWFYLIAEKIKNIVPCGSILDIGCGNGVLLKHFLDSPWSAHGLDFSPWAKTFSRIHGYKLIEKELKATEFPDGIFDVITSISTLEHIAQPFAHVRKIIKLLKPGGLAYFAGIPNYGSFSVKLKICDFFQNLPPGHANYFTRDSLCKLFSHPEIAKDIKKLSVSSYGIPEFHRMYSFIRKIYRLINSKTSKQFRGKNISDNKKNLSFSVRQAMVRTLVLCYYGLGKPFYSGSKLEVMLRKQG